MKRWWLLILLALLAGGFLFQQVAEGSGYILIALGQTSWEMSFWTGVLLLVGSLLGLMLLAWLLRGLWQMLTQGGRRLTIGSNRAVQRRTNQGLVHFIEGNWKQARKQLLGSAKRSEFPLVNYLAAARSSYELGNPSEAFNLLHKAEQVAPNSQLAIALSQARMLLAGRKYEQCLANLERAKKLAPDHPVVLDLLQQTYVRLEDWQPLKKLLPQLWRHKILSDKTLAALEQQLYRALLIRAGEQGSTQNPEVGLQLLKTEWDSIPSAARRQEALRALYTEQLIELGYPNEAEKFIRRSLKQNWHNALVNYYGRIVSDNLPRQLLTAESWLRERPGDAELLLTLGRLSLRNHRWQEAQDYLESSAKLTKRPDTYAELARLYAHLGQYEKSSECYQTSFALAVDPLPELPMPPQVARGQ